eukprot:SAG25_NODE_9384_length_374_cov_1.643636_1_plen_101_part_10
MQRRPLLPIAEVRIDARLQPRLHPRHVAALGGVVEGGHRAAGAGAGARGGARGWLVGWDARTLALEISAGVRRSKGPRVRSIQQIVLSKNPVRSDLLLIL